MRMMYNNHDSDLIKILCSLHTLRKQDVGTNKTRESRSKTAETKMNYQTGAHIVFSSFN